VQPYQFCASSKQRLTKGHSFNRDTKCTPGKSRLAASDCDSMFWSCFHHRTQSHWRLVMVAKTKCSSSHDRTSQLDDKSKSPINSNTWNWLPSHWFSIP